MNQESGSQWRKWDLHFHTPKSFDYAAKGLTPSALVDRLIAAKVEVVAVTDHHTLDIKFIQQMRDSASPQLTILPGVEFACPLGGKEGVHFIGIFPENSDLEYLSSELLSKSEINTKRSRGVPEQEILVYFIETATLIRGLGGLVSIHGHGKSSSIEGIGNNSALKQAFKKHLLEEHVDLLEIGSQERAATYEEKVFRSIGFGRPLIIGSDDHGRGDYPAEKFTWIKADPTFAGLKMALRDRKYRFSFEATPEPLRRLEKHKTKYIKSITFEKLPSMPAGEEWLQGEIQLNSGLVAVIGNKGSGKSALADSIGLLGSCTTPEAFSFLEDKRFRNPKTGRAQHVQGIMQWHAGQPNQKVLSENISADEPERVKYLPQHFVEKVCNELASPGGGNFEDELKKVVFSKVAKADRLGKHSLDDLVEFRTRELRQEADELAAELYNLGEERGRFEARLDPRVKASLENKIKRKEEDLESHETSKPPDRDAPPRDPAENPEVAASLAELTELKQQSESISTELQSVAERIAKDQLRAANAQKLLDKLQNLEKTVARAVDEMATEAEALGLNTQKLVKLTIDRSGVTSIRQSALQERESGRRLVEGESTDQMGLNYEKEAIELKIKELQEGLGRPQQEYQQYLLSLQEWEKTRLILKGSEDDPESLIGLHAEVAKLQLFPSKTEELRLRQEKVARTIHDLRIQEVEVYRELYGSVQKFISEHPLASEHLKLEFNVELVEEGFAEGFLSHVNQNRAGSFHGIEDGSKKVAQLISTVSWSDWAAVFELLHSINEHLHKDKRPGKHDADMLLSEQIRKGKTASELYRWLYSLSYVNPRYQLRWDGKDVGQLSPGERGTLLLIFYLLVDDSDLPLIIDQPEANLDNVTVAEKLVHCIRDARNRRQVIVVTHNPNLAVFCDADQIIHATLDKLDGNRIKYETGGLEHPALNKFSLNVLEGGRGPFDMRDATYRVVGA